MSRLTKLLEYSCANDTKRKKLLSDRDFVSNFQKEDRELLISEASDKDELLRTEVIGAILDGAKSRQSARNIIPIINTSGYSCRIVYGTSPSGQYAPYVAEGAAIPQLEEYYTSSNIGIKKAAVRPNITTEMIEDSRFDQIELELRKAGARLENKLNQEVISTLLDGATVCTNVDPSGNRVATVDIGRAKCNVDNLGYMADSFLITPCGWGYMIDETNVPDIVDGSSKTIGLKVAVLDASTDAEATAQWDNTDAANHYTGLVFDSYNYAVIAMRQDISTELYKDPVHDLVGMVASMRFGVGVVHSGAACRILTKS